MALNDYTQKHRGRPRTSHTDEYCVIVEGLIREDRRVKVLEIAEVSGIEKSTVHEIISDLNFRKVSACWVPKMLTEEHKSKRVAASLENLCCYQDE
jgi:predicted transcriptional regulator